MGGVILDIVYDHLLWQYDLKHQKLNLKKKKLSDITKHLMLKNPLCQIAQSSQIVT